MQFLSVCDMIYIVMRDIRLKDSQNVTREARGKRHLARFLFGEKAGGSLLQSGTDKEKLYKLKRGDMLIY